MAIERSDETDARNRGNYENISNFLWEIVCGIVLFRSVSD